MLLVLQQNSLQPCSVTFSRINNIKSQFGVNYVVLGPDGMVAACQDRQLRTYSLQGKLIKQIKGAASDDGQLTKVIVHVISKNAFIDFILKLRSFSLFFYHKLCLNTSLIITFAYQKSYIGSTGSLRNLCCNGMYKSKYLYHWCRYWRNCCRIDGPIGKYHRYCIFRWLQVNFKLRKNVDIQFS